MGTETIVPSLGFTAVRPVRAYERIVEQVERAIMTGEIEPGGRLPSERELMASFAVSRATVREALRVLESVGLVRSRPGDPRGPEVLQATPELLNKTVTRLVRLGSMDLPDLIAFRIVLEGGACALAAMHRTDEQLESMRTAVGRMRTEIEDGSGAFSRADLEFHSSVWRASRNALISVCGEAAKSALLDLISVGIVASEDRRARMELSLNHDQEIFQAIEERDSALAGRLAKQFVYDYYSVFVPESARESLRVLVA